MKVKITATITMETELEPDDYADEGIHGEEAVVAYELQRMYDEPFDHLAAYLCGSGSLSNIKIEKIEEASPAQEEAA